MSEIDELRFLRALVALGAVDNPRDLLDRALDSLVELTGASRALITIRDDSGDLGGRFQAAFECNSRQVASIEQLVSTGIIAETLVSGELVQTALAHADPRFCDLESVQEGEIESVVCAPLRGHVPGVVYLQRPFRDGVGFDVSAANHVRLFTTAVEPLLDRMALRRATPRPRPELSERFGLVGHSPPLLRLLERLSAVAPLSVGVLLAGGSGTGKTHLARALHRLSGRSGAFVSLNCAAIPDALFESELFGASQGAHSAVSDRDMPGKVTAAEGGTLFFDEVTELSPSAQAKLLHFLQDGTYYRLGETAPRRADVRVIAATNLDLNTTVAEGHFRSDLAYRLRVFAVRLPGLEERSEDIEPIANHVLAKACERHGFAPKSLAPGLAAHLRMRAWPGNVRQLANEVESAVVHSEIRGSSQVELADFEMDDGHEATVRSSLQEATRAFQKMLLEGTLQSTDWNVAETARRLDIARSYAYKLIRSHGLSR